MIWLIAAGFLQSLAVLPHSLINFFWRELWLKSCRCLLYVELDLEARCTASITVHILNAVFHLNQSDIKPPPKSDPSTVTSAKFFRYYLIFRITVRHCEWVGLASYLLISSTSTCTISIAPLVHCRSTIAYFLLHLFPGKMEFFWPCFQYLRCGRSVAWIVVSWLA